MVFPGKGRKKSIANCLGVVFSALTISVLWAAPGGLSVEGLEASIEVDTTKVTGEVHQFLFGQFVEHEHETIQGGLWAELLRDRKFEQGDADKNGVSDGWAPEERITNRYWELVNGQGVNVRYFIDHQEYYGGGASQAIELYGPSSNHGSIYQIGLELMKGRRYMFYVYLKQRGPGKVWVELDKLGGPIYCRKDFLGVSDRWEKHTAEFISPEDTTNGRLRIGVEGHGTFWIDSASLMPADNLRGMRLDVIEALRPLRIPILRYPGGCFADEYHWQNGIGPRDQRPTTWSDKWQEWDPNDFGLDEFMDLAGELGFQPHITTNYSSGTPEEAARWVEYVNGSKETAWGRLRALNGHSEPYNTKFWAVGNEPAFSCIGSYTGGTKLDEYAARFQEYSVAMRKADPSIRIMAGGAPPPVPRLGSATWNRDLLGLLPVDLLTMSLYTGEGHTEISDLTNFYRKVVAEPQEFDQWLGRLIQDMGDRLPRDRPSLAITEYNSFWMPETVDPEYRLCNALYLAGVYNALFRHANQVFLAEWNTLINVQGLVRVNPRGVKLTPPYFAFLLYRNHVGNQVLSTQFSSPMVPFNPQLHTIDAAATLSQDGKTLYLAVINRSEAEEMATTIRLMNWTLRAGTAVHAWELNGAGRDAANPYGSTVNVNIRERDFTIERTTFSYRFPAHSVTVLELSGQGHAL